MKITIKVHRDEVLEEYYLPAYLLIKKNKWQWQSVGAGLTLGGGFLAPVVGTVLNLLASYTRLGYERPVLFKASTACYAITIPLLLVGAHLLDLLDRKNVALPSGEAKPIEQIERLGLRARAEEY